jgi:hypothetical protein
MKDQFSTFNFKREYFCKVTTEEIFMWECRTLFSLGLSKSEKLLTISRTSCIEETRNKASHMD